MENYINKKYKRDYGVNNIYNGKFEIKGTVDMYFVVEWESGRYELMYNKSFYTDLKDGSLTDITPTKDLDLKIIDNTNVINDTIEYCKNSQVNNSRGLRCMLLGDVAVLINMLTGKRFIAKDLEI